MTNRKNGRNGLVAAGLVLASAVAALAYEDGDQQLWVKGSVSGKLGNGAKVKMEQEIKYGDDMGEFYDEESFLAVEFPLADFLKLGIGYRWVAERQNKTAWEGGTEGTTTGADGAAVPALTGYKPLGEGDHYWRQEERPTVDLTLSQKALGWGLEDRVRVEYRMKDDGEDAYFRYRNQIKAKSPWKWTALQVNPYAAWEVNYEDFDEEEHGKDPDFTRHRFYAGVGTKLAEHLKGGLYYCLQRDLDQKLDEWNDAHVAGIEVGAEF